MKNAVIYARVSSKGQEKEGFSIPAQIELLENYASKNSFNIIKKFTESETAKKAGRKAFNEMLAYIKEKNINIILVEKTDRLYRNFKDYILLEDIKGLEIHLVKEGTILSENSKSHEKLIHGFKVLIAKNYIDNLREEINKGREEKIKQGGYPHKAPVGYKNIRINSKAEVVIDKEKAVFVKRLFELYASGFSAKEAQRKLIDEGLYSNEKVYAKSAILKILHDPFYIGKMEIKGVIYDGKHEPLISIDLYNKVQKMFNQSKARTHDVQFDYTGLIKCGHCGCQLTAELKKGKYIYYHCTGKRGGNCKKDYIRQEDIEKVFAALIDKIAHSIPDDLFEEIKQVIKDMQRTKADYEEITQESILKQINTLKKRIDSLYADKLDGIITQEFWEEKHNKWQQEKDLLYAKLQSISKTSDRFYEGSNLLLKFVKDAPQLYSRSCPDKKRAILNLIGSNFVYKDKKLSVELSSVFNYLINNPFLKNGGTQRAKLELFVSNLQKLFTNEFLFDLEKAA